MTEAVGLILDLMPNGDPGEMMRGVRHSFEACLAPDWSHLASICATRCASARVGTRLWAVTELGVLREPETLPVLLGMLADPAPAIASAAMQACAMISDDHHSHRDCVIDAIMNSVRDRPELLPEAQRLVLTLKDA